MLEKVFLGVVSAFRWKAGPVVYDDTMIWRPVMCDLERLLSYPALNVVSVAHMSWSLFIGPGILFVDASLGGVTREDGDRRSESVAVLGRR